MNVRGKMSMFSGVQRSPVVNAVRDKEWIVFVMSEESRTAREGILENFICIV